MATNAALSNFITHVQQALAKIDEGARDMGGLYWQASRLCQFVDGARIRASAIWSGRLDGEHPHGTRRPHRSRKGIKGD